MEKYKQNGFTLIELLAVILILGIIALIAIPTVNKILDEAKKGAFESTLNNIEKKVGDTCSMQLLKGRPIINTYTISGGSITPLVDFKGKLPDGEVYVDNKCNVTYQLTDKVYMASKNNINDKPEITKCNGNCRFKYAEKSLNGATPKLDDSMIPVTIDNDGKVKKADLYSEWYKYDDKDAVNDNSKWANAVITTTASRDGYKKANADTKINQSDIIAYLVWIPRFSYAIPTVSDKENPPLINIQFENKSISKQNGNAAGENYYTHPAFTFGSTELNGIWVGKFETTGTADAPTVLPNVTSLTDQSMSVEFKIAQDFKKNYGLSENSHMMKNSEWDAVAYLSHSKYGSNGQIRINNYWNNQILTGCGASTDNEDYFFGCDIKYANAIKYPQSTTNNISGIFDMSGGRSEYVMGNYKSTLGSSGFTEMPDSKYLDLLNTDTYETDGWYSDIYNMPNSSYPWLVRGGGCSYTIAAGVFGIDHGTGEAFAGRTFRLVILDAQ